MGHIKDPKGVAFLIERKPLTDREREKISEFINARKELAEKRGSTEKRAAGGKKLVYNHGALSPVSIGLSLFLVIAFAAADGLLRKRIIRILAAADGSC